MALCIGTSDDSTPGSIVDVGTVDQEFIVAINIKATSLRNHHDDDDDEKKDDDEGGDNNREGFPTACRLFLTTAWTCGEGDAMVKEIETTILYS